MTFAILGQGTALPSTRFDQVEALGVAKSLCCRTEEQETWLPAMYQGTGIDQRHLVLPRQLVDDLVDGTKHSGHIFLPTGEPDDRGPTTGERMQIFAAEAGALAVEANRRALAEASVRATGVTHLITVSCTGFCAPGVDAWLIERLGLRRTVERTNIGFMGCHGALNGLRVARAFASDPSARVLLCAVELCSLHYHYGWDPGRIIANAIFADGAAAVVGSGQGPQDVWRLAASGTCMFPNTADAMTWTVGDHGFVMSLSKNVPRLIRENLRSWMGHWLGEHGLAVEDIASWAIHPGGPRILESVEAALGLTPDRTADARAVFAAHGNMSSPTVLFIVDRLRRNSAPRPCVALGFGPGLTAEAALLR